MEKYFIPYETGIPTKLVELGFDEECMGIYNKTEFGTYGGGGITQPVGTLFLVGKTKKDGTLNPDFIPAPMYCQVENWLREKHNISLQFSHQNNGYYHITLLSTNDNSKIWGCGNFPYFEGLLFAIENAICLIAYKRNNYELGR